MYANILTLTRGSPPGGGDIWSAHCSRSARAASRPIDILVQGWYGNTELVGITRDLACEPCRSCQNPDCMMWIWGADGDCEDYISPE